MNFAKVHDAQSKLAKAGGNQLGSLLWWSLNGNRIEHDKLADLAGRHGLDAKYLPSEIKPTQAFRRAWRHASTKLPKGLMLRPIAESSDLVTVGLVRERANEAARDLEYDLLTRVTFDKVANRISYEAENQVTADIQRLYLHHMAHTTEDIRSILTAFLSEAGVSLRDSGGVNFIPASHQATLDALCSVVEAAGRNTTFLLPIVDTPEGKKTLRSVAKRTLDDEIQQLQQELGKFNPEKVRQSTLERKLEGFEDLRARVSLFSRVLSFKADSLTKKISGIQATLRQQLDAEPVSPGIPQPDIAPPQVDIGNAEPFAADVGF